MPYSKIRQLIDLAINHEASTGAFYQYLQESVERLHNSIQTANQDQVNSIQFFVIDYIRHVPDCLELVNQEAMGQGLDDVVQPFLAVASDFFANSGDHPGLADLLHPAYLSHRLLEELNDCYLSRTGEPLIPRNLINANLVVHEIIGPEFGEQLEHSVTEMSDTLAQRFQNISDAQLSQAHTSLLDDWPCFGEPHGISLQWLGLVI